MPVARFQDKTFIRLIQDEIAFLLSVVIVNPAASLEANGCLDRCFMPVSAPLRIVHAINIKYSLYFKRNGFLNNGEISPFINKCLQINQVSHSCFLSCLVYKCGCGGER